MPTYRYTPLARTAATNGALLIEAPDRAAAVRALRRRGITPASVEAVDGVQSPAVEAAPERTADGISLRKSGAPGRSFALRRVMSRTEMASFIRELATAVQAGLPLVQGLRTIARQGRSAPQRAMLAHLIREVEHGKPLSDAAASWGRPFGDLTVNLIRAGEVSGRLGEVLEQAADLLDRDVKLRRSLLSATLYPMILAGLVGVAVLIVVTVIVPRILAPLAGQLSARDLPMPTRVVQGVAWFVGGYWWVLLGAAALAAWGWSRLYRRPRARLAIDRAVLRAPLVGRLARDVAVARFTRTLGTLVSAGLPALTALRITRDTLGNRAMERVIDEVCEQVSSGATISEPMERSGLFPPLLVQIVGLGERSGRLPQMLRQAADALEGRTEASVKLVTTALPPILVVILACVVGFVVAAVLFPLLQMQEFIQ